MQGENQKSQKLLKFSRVQADNGECQKAAEEGRKQAEKAREFLNSPEYKK